jgi:phosphopentomutase
LVEGQKEPNPWAICTAQVGRDDKNKYESCVKGVKKQHNINEEELITELETDLKERVQIMLANILAEMPELAQSTPEEKAEIGDALASTLADQLTRSVAEKSRGPVSKEEEAEEIKKSMVAEMSAMAGGAVQGHAGNAFTGEEEDEQKRTTTSRV